MNVDQLRETCKANPFRPFTIHLADGRQLNVPHRDFVSIAPVGRTVIVYQPDGGFNIVDMLLVTDLAVGPETQPSQPAGQ